MASSAPRPAPDAVGTSTGRPTVVILGCGFGGLEAARHLAALDIELVLVDRTNHNLFQPLLYQVSTAALAPSDIGSPIRAILGRRSNVTVILGEAEGIDTTRRRVRVKDTPEIAYDTLIVATGSTDAWFGHDEWAEHAPVLKTLSDALRIRERVLDAFDWAESRTDAGEIAALTTFVVVGGGPTGVELSGSLAELARSTLKNEFRRIDPTQARIVLVDAGSRILTAFPEKLSRYAAKALTGLGVEIRLNAACEGVDATGATVGGERIEAANVFWCAGTRAMPAAQWLGAEAAKNNAIKVGADCTVPGHPEIFAIGDVSSYAVENGTLPGLAPVAKQQGAYVAKVIAARLGRGKQPAAFRYRDLGSLAVIGRSRAIGMFGRVHLTGRAAWLAWSLIHLLLLIGFRNRIVVLANWTYAYLTHGRGSRLTENRDLSFLRQFRAGMKD